MPYEQGESFDDVDLETLVSIVSRHLRLIAGDGGAE
jgi:hypothetical protein